MDLKAILGHVEGSDELIRRVEAEIGRDYVPRAEFNTKNNELKTLQQQIGDLNTSLKKLTDEKATHDKTVADLNTKVAQYETASLKMRIAHETGIPYELAGRLTGDDEKAIRADAESLAKLVKQSTPLQPLRSVDDPAGTGKPDTTAAAYKRLLEGITGT
ncbi:MAG: hypothetical protein QM296_00520 [Bacillota bacterium]|nr:hypothetical protein [Bacillota bacterium]